ncbi:MAG: DNA-binding protein [Desulfobacteraceae bacterium]|nr:DNA-binding protein [Desulfobacteraceae bacterium]
MPRVGISYDQVAAAADGLVANNISPTMKNVREQLGRTGSSNTIQKHLASWREARPPRAAVSPELPESIINAFSREIDRATSEARAEIEGRLVISQAEAAELAEIGEALEVEIDKLMEQHTALSKDRDMLLGKLQEQAGEIERLSRENERERYGAEQARIEVAQMRNKLELQTEKLEGQSATIDTLSSSVSCESQARIIAEKEAAVLAAKLESELQRSGVLLQDKDSLAAQVDAERHSAESARVQAARITNELELQSAAMAERNIANMELSKFYETEKNARTAAEKQIAVLSTRLEEQGRAVIQPLQSPVPGISDDNEIIVTPVENVAAASVI